MRFGLVGPSYTARSVNVADEECINLYPESLQSQGAVARGQVYGGMEASGIKSLMLCPGTKVFATLPQGPVRAQVDANGRIFAVGGTGLYEMASDGSYTLRATILNDGNPVSLCFSNIQLFLVSAGKAYCYTLATNTLTEVTSQLAAAPVMGWYSDGYFVCQLAGNKFQVSAVLDGTTWPGLYTNEVSVFPEDIVSIIVNHRELWVFGSQHCQPYQDTGSNNVFDVIGGTLMEKGCAARFSPCLVDNSVFWVDEDERGARCCWRSSGYTPQRISTYAVETDLSTYSSISGLVSYSYQDSGHLFWVLYIPGAQWSWVYDVTEGMWHKRAYWLNPTFEAHHSWNHVYAFGKHLVGDWKSGNIYELTLSAYDDAGNALRWLRRTPVVVDEMERVFHAELKVDLDTGLGPQPPLTDGAGKPRQPQAMLRWSNDGGHTWSNEHWKECGFAGEYGTFVRWQRMGYARRRVYEVSGSDPIPWTINDGYLRTA